MKIDIRPEIRKADDDARYLMELYDKPAVFNIIDVETGEAGMVDMTMEELKAFGPSNLTVSEYIKTCERGRVKGRITHHKNLRRMQDPNYRRVWNRLATYGWYHSDYAVDHFSIEHSKKHLAQFPKQKLIFVKFV